MKVTFTCKRSGNRVTFTNESDIATMRKEHGYEEIKSDSAVEPAAAQPEKTTKHRGRPRKGN